MPPGAGTFLFPSKEKRDMLIKVERQDWGANFAYAPPLVEAVINTDDIVTAVPCESRGVGPFMKVKFRNGDEMIIRGKPSDLSTLGV